MASPQSPSQPLRTPTFQNFSLRDRDVLRETVKFIRGGPTETDDLKPGYVYATQTKDGYIKIGTSRDKRAQRPEALQKCNLVYLHIYYTQKFKWSHMCEQIVLKLLFKVSRAVDNCPCGTKSHREWFDVDYFVALATINSVMHWMFQEPYEIVSEKPFIAKLTPHWSKALDDFLASQTTMNARDWSWFFGDSLQIKINLSSSIQSSDQSEKHRRSFSSYIVSYKTLLISFVERKITHPPLKHHHSDPSPSLSHSLPSTPAKSASSDNLLGRVRQPDEAQTMPNLRHGHHQVWDVDDSSTDDEAASRVLVPTPSKTLSEPHVCPEKQADRPHDGQSTAPPKAMPNSKSSKPRSKQNSLEETADLSQSFGKMSISTPDAEDSTPSKKANTSHGASLTTPTVVTTPPSSVDDMQGRFANLGLNDKQEAETSRFLEVKEKLTRARRGSRGRSLDASDSDLRPLRPRRQSRRLSGAAPEFGPLEGRGPMNPSPDTSET